MVRLLFYGSSILEIMIDEQISMNDMDNIPLYLQKSNHQYCDSAKFCYLVLQVSKSKVKLPHLCNYPVYVVIAQI